MISSFSLILHNVMEIILYDFSSARGRISPHSLAPPTSVIYHAASASKVSGNLPEPSPRRCELLPSLCHHSFRPMSDDSLLPGPFTFHNTCAPLQSGFPITRNNTKNKRMEQEIIMTSKCLKRWRWNHCWRKWKLTCWLIFFSLQNAMKHRPPVDKGNHGSQAINHHPSNTASCNYVFTNLRIATNQRLTGD